MEYGSAVVIDDFDLDHLLSSFAADQPAPSPPPAISDSNSPVSVTSDPKPDQIASCMGDLERFLMDDDVAGEGEGDGEGFFAERFCDGLFVDELVDSDQAKSESDSAEEMEKKEEEEEESDDPISKKKRRQMRNRDSARSSRERKKMYIKELEMKSRFLESECKRLNYALHCYVTENIALRQQMNQKVKGDSKGTAGADVALQESAVLFVESLPLDSLQCLVSIIWYLLLSLLVMSDQYSHGPSRAGPERELEPEKERKIEMKFKFENLVLLMRRRCKSLKIRMKHSSLIFPVHHALTNLIGFV